MKLVLALVAAIHLVQPSMRHATRVLYAKAIARNATEAGADPFLVAAIITHESQWIPTADNGKCVGLGQICLRTQSACIQGLDTSACKERRLALVNPEVNIRAIAQMLKSWSVRCKAVTGHARIHHVLSGYAGTDSANVHCGQLSKKSRWVDAPIAPVIRDMLAIYRKMQRR